MTVYHYPNCSTCRKALKWLADHDIAFDAIDIVASPPSVPIIRRLHRQSGLPIARLFNTSGERYRAGHFSRRLKTMTDDEAYEALASDGKLIKRPLVDAGAAVLVGFHPDDWARTLLTS